MVGQTNIEVKLELLKWRLTHFDEFLSARARIVMRDVAPNLVRSQLSSGKDSDGNVIQSGYSGSWGAQRFKVGKQVDYVDLNYSGDFYREIYVEEVDLDEYRFGSDVEYTTDIIRRYGSVLGLTETSLSVLRGILLGQLKENALKVLKD